MPAPSQTARTDFYSLTRAVDVRQVRRVFRAADERDERLAPLRVNRPHALVVVLAAVEVLPEVDARLAPVLVRRRDVELADVVVERREGRGDRDVAVDAARVEPEPDQLPQVLLALAVVCRLAEEARAVLGVERLVDVAEEAA